MEGFGDEFISVRENLISLANFWDGEDPRSPNTAIRAQVINKSRPTGRNWVVAPPTQGPMCEEEIVGLSHISCGKDW